LRFVLIALGTLSFLWVLAIGTATLFPSMMPKSFQSACNSEFETDHFAGRPRLSPEKLPDDEIKDKPDYTVYDNSEKWAWSSKSDIKCQPTAIPSNNIIAAAVLTVFFFLGIVGPLLPSIRVKTPFGEYEGPPPPSELTAAVANETDYSEKVYASASRR